jgi:hypothetical protein
VGAAVSPGEQMDAANHARSHFVTSWGNTPFSRNFA